MKWLQLQWLQSAGPTKHLPARLGRQHRGDPRRPGAYPPALQGRRPAARRALLDLEGGPRVLPVAICLSQGLSHACLSVKLLRGETANGSSSQLSLI